jgi:hypothetical protein
MIPPAENSITASPISTRLSVVRGKVLKTLILVIFMLVFVHLAEAQQAKKVPRIGLLVPSSSDSTRKDVFLQGLRDLGYVEGKNIAIEYRYTGGELNRLPDLAAELAENFKIDVAFIVQGRLSDAR